MMKAGLERRLVRLEKADSFQRASLQEQIIKRALQDLSDGDIQLLRDWVVRRASFPEATAEQQAAMRRYQTACDAAARTIGARDGRGRCNRNS